MWFFNKPKKVKPTLDYSRLKKKAPRVPDITCPLIDDVLSRIDRHQDKNKVISKYQWNLIHKRMEQLRTDNELLRDSGRYWYDICKNNFKIIKR